MRRACALRSGKETRPCEPRCQAHRRARPGSLGPAAVGQGPEVWVVGVREPRHGFGEHRVTGPRTSASAQWSRTHSLSRPRQVPVPPAVCPSLPGAPWWPEGSAIGVTGAPPERVPTATPRCTRLATRHSRGMPRKAWGQSAGEGGGEREGLNQEVASSNLNVVSPSKSNLPHNKKQKAEWTAVP